MKNIEMSLAVNVTVPDNWGINQTLTEKLIKPMCFLMEAEERGFASIDYTIMSVLWDRPKVSIRNSNVDEIIYPQYLREEVKNINRIGVDRFLIEFDENFDKYRDGIHEGIFNVFGVDALEWLSQFSSEEREILVKTLIEREKDERKKDKHQEI